MDTTLKIVDDWQQAKECCQRWQQAGETVVFTNGCFDILHAGHVTYLEQARSLGNRLVIGLNTDASVRRLKGARRPIVPQAARARLLAALQAVDMVVCFDEDTPLALIQTLCPDILVKGGDYTEATIVGADFVKGNGGRVEVIPFLNGFSTSNIIEKIVKLHCQNQE
ncbi:D-beta-D-heptose 7-phosphate kinase/D-beta-D-heptose 1-phosphate adenosyltransferase [Thermonema lapsum]|uniref:D-glycero-beta-D-manno-heptose 1-phosphate adenylyltransferase n=1 Tax=Thermonema lapsum TaxID=28195 RepID=A0A846MMA4_9BACT|nr:D-glycero-beta-D-manno-heptose 1-phosphate adenylyltransferase [Thermonema lapsum]NIK72562.1 D-beta-D-heptose 7-phosphate kinase/D-beta-D-heptose 1-phosphate adenosyltransferase [Thermonema lapsum]